MMHLLYTSLKTHLTRELSALTLLGQTADGTRVTAPQVFIGDLPAKRGNTPERVVRELPCVVIVPLSGHLDVEDGASESVAEVAFSCAVYSPPEGGDLEGPETELAVLLSAVTRALLPCAQGVPLVRRFVLAANDKGKMLAWVRPEEQPKPFFGATITSRWIFKGWE